MAGYPLGENFTSGAFKLTLFGTHSVEEYPKMSKYSLKFTHFRQPWLRSKDNGKRAHRHRSKGTRARALARMW